MEIYIYISLAVLLLAVLFLLFLYKSKKNTNNSKKHRFSQPNTKNNEVIYTYLTCERCNKKNYINKNSISKLCSNCGWNLSEPYINVSFQVTEIPQDVDQHILTKMKTNDPVYIRFSDHPEDHSGFAIYNKDNQHIGWLPTREVLEIAPDIYTSIRIFGKIKRKNANGYEVQVTNDIQKMWGY